MAVVTMATTTPPKYVNMMVEIAALVPMLMIAFAISPFWVATLHIREFLVMASMTTHTTMNIQEQSAGSMVEIAALFLMLVIIAIILPLTGHLSQEGVTLIFSSMPWV
jgi:hypothetical protein